MSGKIFAPDKTTGLVNDPNDATNKYSDVTASTVGTKRGLHFTALGSAGLASRIDDAGSGVTYVGKAPIGSATSSAVWQVFKMVESTGDLTITWADSDDAYDNIWDNRASLTYG